MLEDQIYLYDIQTMKLLYTIETSPNPSGTALEGLHLVQQETDDRSSHLCPFALSRKLLLSLSFATKGIGFGLCSSFTHTSEQHPRSTYVGRSLIV